MSTTIPAETKETLDEFKKAGNMSPKTLAAWLKTAESKSVGFNAAEGREPVGHDLGKMIIALLGKSPKTFSEGDVAHAREVVGFVHRHLAQRPAGDTSKTPWRYSLMNWGHDPTVR